MGVIPDKFILIDIHHDITIDKVKRNLKSEESLIKYKEEEIGALAEASLTEYKL